MKAKKINEKSIAPKKSKEVSVSMDGTRIITTYLLDGEHEVQIFDTEPMGIDPDFHAELKKAIKKFQVEAMKRYNQQNDKLPK